MAPGFRFGVTLIAFYLTSSKLTRWRADLKQRLEAGHAVGGRRTAAQVLANSWLGAVLAVTVAWLQAGGGGGSESARAAVASVATAAFVAFFSVCCADTWSSEVGIASPWGPPRLATTFRRVPPGTNGGVSPLGTAAAAAGGAFVGLSYCGAAAAAAAWDASLHSTAAAVTDAEWKLVWLALAAGLCGSWLDRCVIPAEIAPLVRRRNMRVAKSLYDSRLPLPFVACWAPRCSGAAWTSNSGRQSPADLSPALQLPPRCGTPAAGMC